MEKCTNDLKSLMKQAVYLDEEHIKYMIYQIICGMRYMHSANILHRDLKPANILINEDCSIKICDLGLARSYARQNQEIVSELSVITEEDQESPNKEDRKQSRNVPRSSKMSTIMRAIPARGL
jgi:mitogen-activated protein kinase 1/3